MTEIREAEARMIQIFDATCRFSEFTAEEADTMDDLANEAHTMIQIGAVAQHDEQ